MKNAVRLSLFLVVALFLVSFASAALIENANSCSGDCTGGGGSVWDGNYGTFIDKQAPGILIYLNYTDLPEILFNLSTATFTIKYEARAGEGTIDYNCWDGSSWILAQALNSTSVATQTFSIPQTCLDNGDRIYRIKINATHDGVYGSHVVYEERINYPDSLIFDGGVESGAYYLDENNTLSSTQTIGNNTLIDCQGHVVTLWNESSWTTSRAFNMNDANNVTIRNCVFTDNRTEYLTTFYMESNAHNILFENTVFDGLRCGGSEGFCFWAASHYLDEEPSIAINNCTFQNTILETGTSLIWIQGNFTLTNSTFYDLTCSVPGTCYAMLGNDGSTGNWIVNDNLFQGVTYDASAYGNALIYVTPTSSGSLIANNNRIIESGPFVNLENRGSELNGLMAGNTISGTDTLFNINGASNFTFKDNRIENATFANSAGLMVSSTVLMQNNTFDNVDCSAISYNYLGTPDFGSGLFYFEGGALSVVDSDFENINCQVFTGNSPTSFDLSGSYFYNVNDGELSGYAAAAYIVGDPIANIVGNVFNRSYDIIIYGADNFSDNYIYDPFGCTVLQSANWVVNNTIEVLSLWNSTTLTGTACTDIQAGNAIGNKYVGHESSVLSSIYVHDFSGDLVIENNDGFAGVVAYTVLLTSSFTNLTVRNNNFSSYWGTPNVIYLYARYAKIYADIYGNNFDARNGTFYGVVSTTSFSATGELEAYIHDNTFNGTEMWFYSRKTNAAAPDPVVSVYNNNFSMGVLSLPLMNDSYSARNYVDFSGNTYDPNVVLNIFPYRSIANLFNFLYPLSFGSLFDKEPYNSTVNHIMKVWGYISPSVGNVDTYGVSSRVIYGGGADLSGLELSSRVRNDQFINFTFSNMVLNISVNNSGHVFKDIIMSNVTAYTDATSFAVQNAYGAISWNQVNLTGQDLASNIYMSDNLVGVNSAAVPALNTSASVSINVAGLVNPVILRDGLPCEGGICSGMTYVDGKLNFSVTQFSNYSGGNGSLPVCSVCNETCSPCGGGCNATDMSNMFYGITNFDTTIGDITGWNTSCITNMYGMFYGSDFNQDIGGWDTSQVTNMAYMFAGATSFDQNIGSWNVSQVIDMTDMFYSGGLSTSNYDALLNGWASQVVQYSVPFYAGNSVYSSAALSARNDTLIGIYGWVIYDGGMLFSCVNDTDCGTCQKCNVGTGDCVVQNSSEDLKNECSQYIDACLNLYTQSGPNGYCDGAGACDANSYQQNVSAGNVCYSSMDAQPDITTHCGIWSDCLLHNTTAQEYYVGFVGDGTATCVATDWQSAGTFQSASLGYWWSATGQMDTCSETAFCSNDADCGFCQKCDVGTGVCGYQSSSEDAKGQCDPGVYSCSNAYTYAAATGFCNGAGSCDAAQSHVSLGKVCINSTAYDAAPTSSIKCGVWSDCLLYNITAPEYYVGYYSSGTSCDATGWQPAGTYQSSDPGYRWDVTGAIDQCTESVYCTVDSDCSACKKCDVGSGNCVNQNATEDIKGDCTAGLSGCFNIGIKSGPDGLCNGYGSCDTNSNRVNVALGKVCLAGADVDPSAAAYCGIWSDCAYHATSAPEYYVGVKGDGTTVCNETGWVSVGTTQNASPGYWWAYAGKVDQCMPELSGGCAIDSDCGPCRVCSNFTCVNELATQDTKNDCTAGFNACADSYTRIGPNGLCNGAGSCDVNSNVANVSENRICYNGEDRLPCGFWDYCLSHDTSAQRYSTGIIDYVDGNEVCIETGWAPFGNSYPAAGYYWATTELREASGTAVQCAQIPIPDYCFSDDDCSFCNKCVDGACVNETGEDVKNECAADSCFNAYTFYGTSYTGLCDGTGNCQISNGTGVYTNVSKGKVCVNGSNSNPTSGVNCGVWSNCYWGTSVANEYYVGYLGDGTLSCSYNDVFGAATWVSAGTIQNATPLVFSTPSQYSPQQIDQCTEVQCVDDAGCGLCQKCSANVCVPQTASEDLKDQCTVAYDSCLTNYILQSSHGSGYCNGAGACDNSTTGYKNVSTGNVCIGGNDTAPTAGVHCDDKWSDCVRYATIAPEYYVGYVGTGVNICNPSNWVAAGTNQTVISGFWDATGRFESCNAVGCSQDTDCGFCNKCVAGSCVLENSTEDTKNQCPIHYSSCTNAWTLHGADSTGTCNGAGACNNVSNPLAEANVTIGNVCQSGLDTNPNLTVHCGIWSNCQLHGRTAPEYYVGYRGNGSDICVSTDWKYTGTNQIATTRYWWSSFGYMDNCTEEKACSLPNTGTVTYGIYPAYDDCYINKLTFENNIVIDCNGYSLIKNGSQNVMLNMVNNKNVSIYNCGIVESTGSRQPLYLNNAHDILLQNDTYLYLDTPSADLFVAHNSSIALRDSKFSDFVVDMDGASVVDYANNVINETGTVHLRLTSNGGTSVMMMHDSNFTANTLHFTIKRTVNGDNFTLYFYNNTMTANHVEYPIFGDSMTTPNVADFFSNRYYVGDVTLYPAISDPMATLFDINLTGWFTHSNDLFRNKVNLIVNNSMVADGNASSDRTILGDGLMLYDTVLGSDANLTLIDFIFNNSIYDFGNGTYINNTILYVSSGDISIASASIYPFEGDVINPVVDMSVVDEFSTVEAVNLTLTHFGNVTNLTKEASCDPLANTCTIPLNFYDQAGDYNYTDVLVKDRFGSTPEYSIFGGVKYYLLTALMKDREFVTFSGSVIGVQNVKCDVPIQLINSGNGDITNMTLIAYDLVGETDPTKIMPASSFRAGDILQNSVQLNNSVPVQLLLALDSGNKSYIRFNLWISAPADTYPQSYYSPHSWSLVIS